MESRSGSNVPMHPLSSWLRVLFQVTNNAVFGFGQSAGNLSNSCVLWKVRTACIANAQYSLCILNNWCKYIFNYLLIFDFYLFITLLFSWWTGISWLGWLLWQCGWEHLQHIPLLLTDAYHKSQELQNPRNRLSWKCWISWSWNSLVCPSNGQLCFVCFSTPIYPGPTLWSSIRRGAESNAIWVSRFPKMERISSWRWIIRTSAVWLVGDTHGTWRHNLRDVLQ